MARMMRAPSPVPRGVPCPVQPTPSSATVSTSAPVPAGRMSTRISPEVPAGEAYV